MPHFEPCRMCGKIECSCLCGINQTPNGIQHISSPASERFAQGVARLIKETTQKKQIGGDHYLVLPIQPWTIIDANRLNFYEGCALKYLLRKKGNRVEDLEKAIHYLEHEIEYLKGVRLKECLQCGGPSNEKDILYYGCCVKCAHEPVGPSFSDQIQGSYDISKAKQEEPGWDKGFWLCGSCGVKNKNCWNLCPNCKTPGPLCSK